MYHVIDLSKLPLVDILIVKFLVVYIHKSVKDFRKVTQFVKVSFVALHQQIIYLMLISPVSPRSECTIYYWPFVVQLR